MNVNLIWQEGMTLASLEKDAILQALRYYRGNKTLTARSLGMSVRNLDNKLDSYKMDEQSEEKRIADDKSRAADFLLRSRGLHPDQLARARGEGNTVKTQGLQTNAGLRGESSTQIPSEQPMPVSERQEVQNMLPADDADGATGKHSKAVRRANGKT